MHTVSGQINPLVFLQLLLLDGLGPSPSDPFNPTYLFSKSPKNMLLQLLPALRQSRVLVSHFLSRSLPCFPSHFQSFGSLPRRDPGSALGELPHQVCVRRQGTGQGRASAASRGGGGDASALTAPCLLNYIRSSLLLQTGQVAHVTSRERAQQPQTTLALPNPTVPSQ